MKKLLVLSTLLFVFTGCGIGRMEIVESYDKQFSIHSTWLQNNECKAEYPGSIYFNMVRFQKKDSVEFNIDIVYVNDRRLSIERGKSLMLLVDNEKVEFNGEGSINNRVLGPSGIQEDAFYALSVAMLNKLSNAKTIQGVVFGESGQKEFELQEKNILAIKRFCEKIEGKK
jgi:hypothetical protein